MITNCGLQGRHNLWSISGFPHQMSRKIALSWSYFLSRSPISMFKVLGSTSTKRTFSPSIIADQIQFHFKQPRVLKSHLQSGSKGWQGLVKRKHRSKSADEPLLTITPSLRSLDKPQTDVQIAKVFSPHRCARKLHSESRASIISPSVTG
jgi:hypothetical protein